MTLQRRKKGNKHPDTLTSMAHLASTFWHQRRWKEAEELEVQVMKTSKPALNLKTFSTEEFTSEMIV
ncbi:hypothetical protein EMCG_09001 [[Emmonsia] crescens]|uniref:Uncharacterized protein n=1 Tax=[Emmonsia] crescens TaxID=73230 RepID=A0A0G2JA63_9EURO|nr:hypothetical protein EMCG_09001 [Emmonsia crescens UAMH 3008]